LGLAHSAAVRCRAWNGFPWLKHSNFIERTFGENRCRVKVIGRLPGETSCLTLVWAVLDLLITHQTNGIHFNALDRQRLKRARYQGNEQTIPEEVTAAYTHHHREPNLQRQRDATHQRLASASG
jgi:hypothetical protein